MVIPGFIERLGHKPRREASNRQAQTGAQNPNGSRGEENSHPPEWLFDTKHD